MTATDAQEATYRRYFNDTAGAPNEIWTSEEIDDVFDDAAAVAIDSDNANLVMVEAKILGIDQLMIDAAKRVTYTQNSSSENQSDISKRLGDMREKLEADRKRFETRASGGGVSSFTRKKVPVRQVDRPYNADDD